MDPGQRDRRVIFQSETTAENAFGEDEETGWVTYAEAWAQVSFGTGTERRDAAQEGASAPATFRVPWSVKLAALTTRNRISFLGAPWDIESVVPVGFKEQIEITAMRKAP